MIAYFFPPEGNAGTYRPLRFSRYLSKMGWRPNVISVDPYSYERYDHDLLNSVPKEVNVIRVRGHDLWQAFNARRARKMKAKLSVASKEQIERVHSAQRASIRSGIREIVRKIEGCYYLPDQAKSWIRPAVNASLEICREKKPNIIWATVGPVSSGVVAQQTSEQVGVPYVLDFRDPWGLNYYQTDAERPKLVAQKACRVMYRMLKQAQSVVFLFETVAECYQRAYPGALEDKKIHIIPNGYDGSIEDIVVPKGDKCTILYAGTLSTYRYDTLIEAIALFRKAEPEYDKQLHLMFIGDGMHQFRKRVEALGLSNMIEISPATSYAEILRLQRNVHALLILGRQSDRRGHELVAGAKLFEYLKARRPIIGVLPNDETKKILESVGVSTIADVNSLNGILMTFRQVLDAWKRDALTDLLPNREACETYSAEKQSIALIRALEGEIAEKPFTSGAVNIPPSLQGEFGT